MNLHTRLVSTADQFPFAGTGRGWGWCFASGCPYSSCAAHILGMGNGGMFRWPMPRRCRAGGRRYESPYPCVCKGPATPTLPQHPAPLPYVLSFLPA